MKYCNTCSIYIREDKNKCTLCKNSLVHSSKEGFSEDIFPEIPPSYKSHLAIKIMIFISILVMVVSISLNMIFPIRINSPVLIILGIISIWISFLSVLRNRHNVPKNILWQAAVVFVLSIFWDWKIGWSGWSLNYVIPISCVSAMVIMYVTAKIMNLSVRDYIVYTLIDGLFGIIPTLFILFDWVDVYYPSIICVGISILSIAAIFIFQGENIKAELDKRMHI